MNHRTTLKISIALILAGLGTVMYHKAPAEVWLVVGIAGLFYAVTTWAAAGSEP